MGMELRWADVCHYVDTIRTLQNVLLVRSELLTLDGGDLSGPNPLFQLLEFKLLLTSLR